MKFSRYLTILALIIIILTFFTACDTAERVTVTFMADGDVVQTFEVVKGAAFGGDFPNVPKKEGYIGSWSIVSIGDVSRDLTVTAVYSKNFLTATFYVDGKYHRKLEIEYGTNPTLPEIPTKIGHIGAWDTTDFSQARTDKTVHAVYTPMQMKITFKSTGFDDIIRSVPYGSSLENIPDVPFRAGLKGSWGEVDFTTVKSDMTVTAVYSPAVVQVTLNGADEDTQEINKVNYGAMFTLPATQSRQGYLFVGWFTDESYQFEALGGEMFEDVIIHAYWIKDNAAEATALSKFSFTLLSDGTYAVAAADAMSGAIIIPNIYNGALVTEIAEAGFLNKFTLEAVVLPEALRKIGKDAFRNCDNLTTVTINSLTKLKEIGGHAFHNSLKLTSLTVPSSLETIGEYAFAGTALTQFEIPHGSELRSVGSYAFYELNKIALLNVSSKIEKIGDYAFAGMKGCIFNFEGLNALIEVGEHAFENCERLPSFVAPNIQRMGDMAFAGCNSLAELLVLGTRPVSVYFGDSDFIGSYEIRQQVRIMDSGEYVLDEDGNYTYHTLTSWLPSSLNTLRIKQGTEEVVEYFANNVFSVHTLYVPASVVRLGKFAYSAQDEDVQGMMRERLGNVYFAEGSLLTEIGNSAFYMRENFTSITLPAQLEIIGDNAFDYARNLKNITVLSNRLVYSGKDAFRQTSWMNNHASGVMYIGNIAIGYSGIEQVSSLNLTLNENTTAIAPFAFEGLMRLVSVTVPASVKNIGEYAFSNTGLTSATVVGFGTMIGRGAFARSPHLISVALPDAAVIEADVLLNCPSLKNLSYYGDFVIGLLFGTSGENTYSVAQTQRKMIEFGEDSEKIYFQPVLDIYSLAPSHYTVKLLGLVDVNGEPLEEDLVYTIYATDGFFHAEENMFQLFLQKHPQPKNDFYDVTGLGGFYLPTGAELKNHMEITAVFEGFAYVAPAALETVVLSGSAQREIAAFALKDLRIKNLTLTSGIVAIGESAFENCQYLSDVSDLPASLLAIGKSAFYGASALRDLGLGESLAKIGDYAFMHSALTSVRFPKSLEYIGAGAFQNCETLTNLNFAQSEKELIVGDDAFKNIRITVFNAPDNIVSLGNGAFANNKYLSSVVFGENSLLRELGDYAFSDCTSLTDVVLPKGLDLSSGEFIFNGSYYIRSLSLSYGAYDAVGDYPDVEFYAGVLFGTDPAPGNENYAAMQNGINYYVPASLSTLIFNGGYVPSGMFENFYAIRNITLASGVWSVGGRAFANCEELVSAAFSQELIYIGEEAFLGCNNINEYGGVQGSALSYIGKKAFKDNINLVSFDMPHTLNTLNESVFENTGLKSIDLSSVIAVGAKAFKDNANLAWVMLSDSLETIGEEAFYNCVNAYFPFKHLHSLREIGELAFYRCSRFYGLGMDNIENIGALAFEGANYIKEVTLPGGTVLGMLFGNGYYEDTYEVMQGAAYRIPSSLEKVTISLAAKSVASAALKDSISLRELEFLGEPPLIGLGFAENCDFNIFVPILHKDAYIAALPALAHLLVESPANSDYFTFTPNGGGYNLSLSDGAMLPPATVLPSYYAGLPVTGIAPYAFYKNTALTKIIIPASIVSIGEYAFFGCENLAEISFERGSELQSIGNYAFASAKRIAEISLPATLETIGDSAFAGKSVYNAATKSYDIFSALEKVIFEEGSTLKNIGKNAFSHTVSLQEIALPSSLENIGEAAFIGSGLTSIYINVKLISDRAFMQTALQEVVFGDNVAEIGRSAFEDCTALTALDLNKVVTVGEMAFYGAFNLTDVNLGAVQTLRKEAFAHIKGITQLSIPQTVSYIGEKAFYGCDFLSQLEMNPNDAFIGEDAFGGTAWYKGLESEGILYLGDSVYKTSESLTGAVTLKEGTQSIVSSAFKNSLITSITIPSSLKYIGDYAFYNSALTEILYLSSTLETIGSYAFSGCENLTNFDLPSTLRVVGESAFENTALSFDALPTGLERIYSRAFYGISFTETVTLPASLLEIGEKAFSHSGATFIFPESLVYKIGDYAFEGALISEFSFPTGVTVLGKAFARAEFSCGVVLPVSVTDILEGAFEGVAISSIATLPQNALVSIGSRAFYGLSSTQLDLQGLENLNTVGSEAFADCTELTRFYASNVTFIGKDAFSGCSKLEIASTLGGAAMYSFAGAPLQEVHVAVGVTSIANGAFFGLETLQKVVFPATLKSIGEDAFNSCVNLSTVEFVMADALINVGKDAFQNTSWLDAQQGVVLIGSLLYKYKGSETAIRLQRGITAILEGAFSNTGIVSIVIPVTVQTIGRLAFAHCTALNLVTFTSGSALNYVGDSAFAGCISLSAVDLPAKTLIGITPFIGCTGITSIKYGGKFAAPLLFGDSVENVPSILTSVSITEGAEEVVPDAFKGMVSLQTVNIPSSLKRIGASAFSGCNNLTEINILASSSLSYIGNYAFENTALRTLYLPNSIEELGLSILSGVSTITKISTGGAVAKENLFPESAPASLEHLEFIEGTSEIAPLSFAGFGVSVLTIARSVEVIGYKAFYGMPNLQTLILTNSSLEIIGESAFEDCSALLSELILPASMKEIGRRAFYGCLQLENVTISAEDCIIGEDAFTLTAWESEREGLVVIGATVLGYKGDMPEDFALVLPSNITSISNRAFDGKTNLKSVTIPSTVKEIGAYAFANCENLETVVFEIGSSLTSLSVGMFENCSALTQVDLPLSVGEIPEYAFYGASSLASLELPLGLTVIGESAFENTALTGGIALPDSVTEIGARAFYGLSELIFGEIALQSLEKVGESAFYGCLGITKFVAEDILTYGANAFHGALNITEITLPYGVNLPYIFGSENNVACVHMANGITEIEEGLFEETEVTTVILSDGIRVIGKNAFKNSAVESVTFSSVEIIAEGAFEGAYNLQFNAGEKFVLSDSVVSIGNRAFKGAVKLLEIIFIGTNITYIGDEAFAGLSSTLFTGVEFPKLAVLGERAFADCELLTHFSATELIVMGEGAFTNCATLESLYIVGETSASLLFGNTAGEGLYPVTEGTNTYYVPSSLKRVVISRASSNAVDYILSGFLSLEEVQLSKIRRIGASAFAGTAMLKNISIPGSVISIGEKAFEYSGVEEVRFENERVLSTVGRNAFNETVWYGNLLAEHSGGFIFIGKALYAVKGNLVGSVTVPDGTLSITSEAFNGQTNITAVNLPLTLVEIGHGAFTGCEKVSELSMPGSFLLGAMFGTDEFSGSYTVNQQGVSYQVPMSLTKVSVKTGSKVIVADAFKDCYSLEEIDLPEGILVQGAVLAGCYGLEQITVAGNIILGTLFGSSPYANSYIAQQNQINYHIPNTLYRLTVRGSTISDYAYQNITSITVISLSSVKKIGKYALYNCSGLTSINLNAQAESIGDFAFAKCTFGNIVLPATASLGIGILSGCQNLNSVTVKGTIRLAVLFGTDEYAGSYRVDTGGISYYIPIGLITVTLTGTDVIADYALYGLTSVVSVHLPSQVKKIGAYAFYNMAGLTEIALSSTLQEIGGYAFYNCNNLNIAINQNSLETIGEYAFAGCGGLTALNSDAVREIGNSAFTGCGNLTSLTINVQTDFHLIFSGNEFTKSYRVEKTVEGTYYVYYLPNALATLKVVGEGDMDSTFFEGTRIVNVIDATV